MEILELIECVVDGNGLTCPVCGKVHEVWTVGWQEEHDKIWCTECAHADDDLCSGCRHSLAHLDGMIFVVRPDNAKSPEDTGIFCRESCAYEFCGGE